jgi:hypothetical protein
MGWIRPRYVCYLEPVPPVYLLLIYVAVCSSRQFFRSTACLSVHCTYLFFQLPVQPYATQPEVTPKLKQLRKKKAHMEAKQEYDCDEFRAWQLPSMVQHLVAHRSTRDAYAREQMRSIYKLDPCSGAFPMVLRHVWEGCMQTAEPKHRAAEKRRQENTDDDAIKAVKRGEYVVKSLSSSECPSSIALKNIIQKLTDQLLPRRTQV